jgi:hypothetical protein
MAFAASSIPPMKRPGARRSATNSRYVSASDNPPRYDPVLYGDYLIEQLDRNYAHRNKMRRLAAFGPGASLPCIVTS